MMSDDYNDDNGEDSVPVKTKIKKKAKDKNKGGLAVKTKKKSAKKKAPGGTGEFAAKLTGQKIPFDASAPNKETRLRGQQRWQEWWEKNRATFGS